MHNDYVFVVMGESWLGSKRQVVAVFDSERRARIYMSHRVEADNEYGDAQFSGYTVEKHSVLRKS